MALQVTGPISLSQINTELGRSSTATISLDTAENGGYVAINTCSPSYPLAANAASMSEWYGYNHSASCGNSAYALTDGGNSVGQNMLYSNTLSYSSTVSSTKPDPRNSFSISFWLKRATDDSYQGYLFGLNQGTSTDDLRMFWGSYEDPNDPGVYANRIYIAFDGIGGSYMYSTVNLSDANNVAITGIAPNSVWDTNNRGNVDPHKYSLITVVVDYAFWSTDNYVTWYWNDTKLEVPWTAGAGFQDSGTYGDSVTNPSWTNAVLTIAGSIPSELSSGCQLDSYAVFLSSALTSGDVSVLYNGGEVASLSDYQSISTDIIYYNFESDSPSLGEDTGSNYGMFLDELGNPQRIADPAV